MMRHSLLAKLSLLLLAPCALQAAEAATPVQAVSEQSEAAKALASCPEIVKFFEKHECTRADGKVTCSFSEESLLAFLHAGLAHHAKGAAASVLAQPEAKKDDTTSAATKDAATATDSTKPAEAVKESADQAKA